jgi:AI-2 transport protein TqsA
LKDSPPITTFLRFLLGAACTVIILWGIKAASEVLSPVLLGLLLAYATVPFPTWLMQRFKISKGAAIAVTGAAVICLGLYLLFALNLAAGRISERLPVYQVRLIQLYEQLTVFASAHGVTPPSISVKSLLTPERLSDITRFVLPAAGVVISDGLLIFFLAFLIVMEMLQGAGAKQSPLAAILSSYGADARVYVTVTARSAAINAAINLVFLFLMGVDTPVIWSALYFLLDFIPTLGFILALVPPTFVTLLMYGWKRALLVAGGLILTNAIVDNVVTPIFMRHAVDVSFLEITLSLLGWTFLLGLTGAILSIPLTLGLKKAIATSLRNDQPSPEPSG